MAHFGRRGFVMAAMAGVSAIALGGCAAGSAGLARAPQAERPNIVFILADDMGWGDMSAYNPHSAIPTPNLERLAQQGMRFTDMHSSSAVCTPSRYSVLTGRYPWRSSLKKGVLSGYSPSLIEPQRLTVAGLLKQAGYYTAGVGKWHLGLGEQKKADFSQPFHPAPTDLGFDYYLGLPASLDIPPYLYFENDRALAAPTAHTNLHGKDTRPFGPFWRGGPMAPGFEFERVVPEFTAKAVEIIERAAAKDSPFFLYFALPSPHTPWLPLPEYQGKSGAGDYGDYVYETDAMVGKVLAALEDAGVADDTLVVFTSDNGAPWDEEHIDRWAHRANADWRGRKSDVWEGGHRIPCLIRWPGHVAPGSISHEMLQLTDFMATAAAITGQVLPADAAEDSFDMLPALEQRGSAAPVRESMISESGKGLMAIREGTWKLELGLGSGGFSEPAEVAPAPGGPQGQLYDLAADPHERNNVWSHHPDIVERLTRKLEAAEKTGRTRPI